MNVSEYIMEFLVKQGIDDVFFISGGGNRYLAEALAKNPNLRYVCNHNEQSLSYCVEGYTRLRGIGVGLVTTGPGVTNAISGLYGAWLDSTPCIFISGQVNVQQTIRDSGLRQFGVQEVNTLPLVKPITKYAVTVDNPNEIRYHLEKALYLAKSGRPGPVWLDVPLNIQNTEIDEQDLIGFTPSEKPLNLDLRLEGRIKEVIRLIEKSERPIIYIGQGVRLSGAEEELNKLMEKLEIPLLLSWNASDLISDDDSLYIGRPGMFGQRAANFSIQNCDLLISIGTRLSVAQTGYNFKTFARGAKKVFVDIDESELLKKPIKPDVPIISDSKEFLKELNNQLQGRHFRYSDWLVQCKKWKEKYPNVLPSWREEKDFVNSYVFVDELSNLLSSNDVIVTDMGTSFTGTYQAIKVKKGQRVITSSGLAAMGFGLPGSIGACVGNNRERTICISGDGGMQFNIQELETIKHNNLPIKIFVINNGGYLTMKEMHKRGFGGNYIGAEKNSGVSLPDFVRVSEAYGIPSIRINNHVELKDKLNDVLNTSGPFVCEIMMNPDQPLEPRMISKVGKSGKKYPAPLEEMAPFLSEEELKENMIIPLHEE